ncbi:hypothetical protein NXS19_013123 [Fusarium pseudograminearum]|nr:hypothetical protein NXS19_013123 [Fusarium pseudograminearum]
MGGFAKLEEERGDYPFEARHQHHDIMTWTLRYLNRPFTTNHVEWTHTHRVLIILSCLFTQHSMLAIVGLSSMFMSVLYYYDRRVTRPSAQYSRKQEYLQCSSHARSVQTVYKSAAILPPPAMHLDVQT